jgi:putrescine transport system permease protein
VPILSMIVYSFNRSRLVSVWGGFSTEWYGRLLGNRQLLEAALLSLKIGLVSASIATVLGVMAGLALARFRRFPGRMALSGLLSAPLVMPDVLTGIALLMAFLMAGHVIGWPAGRGFTTITIAHVTVSVTYVAAVVRARLADLDPSLEEAALDLGARPAQVLFDITLPAILPAIVSGWLLAFTISLDEAVITSFVSGPGSTTLPVLVWSKVRLGVSPDINALATLLVVAVALGVTLAGLLMARGARRQARDGGRGRI